MSTPVGFRFLYDAGYINREMETWFNVSSEDGLATQFYNYLLGAEYRLRCWCWGISCQSLQFLERRRGRGGLTVRCFYAEVATHTDRISNAFDGTVPGHFYGEMAKTELGCQVLQEKGHFSEFAQFIRQHSHENEDMDLILKLKSILWAVVSFSSL